jgi:3-demethoxyubiquinol 3-hydroxylase
MAQRHFSLFDRAILGIDQALRTLTPGMAKAERPNPAETAAGGGELTEAERRHAAGLMRVNHTGEVCAQALYQGQALTARQDRVGAAMARAAREEADHLAWCEQRLRELDSRTSYLNPLFYGLSFTIGAAAGALGDRYSLGFVAATEDQVCQHLQSHLQRLPEQDGASRALLTQMLEDEAGHATVALESGGLPFPGWVKKAMSQVSEAMTRTTYYV